MSILGSKSAKVPLTRGVPQGSILGLIAFTAYTLPLGDIARKYHLGSHVYVDDTQIYLAFYQNDPTSAPLAINSIESCISEIHDWMRLNKLKLNDDRTDILLFSSNPLKTTPSVAVTIGADLISPSAAAKNLGVTLDPTMSLAPQITNICKVTNYHPYRISRIRKYLTPNATQTIIHSLISSRIDYCNSILYGLPK